MYIVTYRNPEGINCQINQCLPLLMGQRAPLKKKKTPLHLPFLDSSIRLARKSKFDVKISRGVLKSEKMRAALANVVD